MSLIFVGNVVFILVWVVVVCLFLEFFGFFIYKWFVVGGVGIVLLIFVGWEVI